YELCFHDVRSRRQHCTRCMQKCSQEIRPFLARAYKPTLPAPVNFLPPQPDEPTSRLHHSSSLPHHRCNTSLTDQFARQRSLAVQRHATSVLIPGDLAAVPGQRNTSKPNCIARLGCRPEMRQDTSGAPRWDSWTCRARPHTSRPNCFLPSNRPARLLPGSNEELRGSPYGHRFHAHKEIREPFALRPSFDQMRLRTIGLRRHSLVEPPLLPDMHYLASTGLGLLPGLLSAVIQPSGQE